MRHPDTSEAAQRLIFLLQEAIAVADQQGRSLVAIHIEHALDVALQELAD
jgi:hypothetical protein